MLSLLGMGNRRASAIPPPASRPTHAQPMGHASDAEIEAGRPQLLTLDGWMNKEGEVFKSWKRRYFKLQGTCLPYYTESGDLKGFIQLENAIVRDSLRKGMELGFEIVCNPSQATRDGGLVIAPSGEASYATAAHSPAHGSGSSGGSSAPAVGTAASPAERVYYLCVEPTTPPTLAQQQRKEWMQTIANNVSYESRLHAWVSEREGRHSSAVEQLQAQVEAVRAEREMERFAAASAARERESALREEMEKARQEGHARTLSRLPVELAASISLSNAEEGEGAGDGDAQGDGSVPRPPLSPRIKPQTLLDRPAALALAVDAAQSAQREADATLIGGSGLDVPSAIAALKRKNQSLEADVRMILAENASLKTQAAQALDEARKALAEEKAAVQARRQEVEAECARARAQVAEAQEAVAKANAQAEAAAAQAAAATAAAAAATAAVTAAVAASPSAADSTIDPSQGPVVDVSAATMLSPSADSILAQMATPRSATPALAGAGSSASAAYFAQASSPAPPSPRAAGGAASPAPIATPAAVAAGPMAGLSLNPPSPATQVSSRRGSFSAGASIAAALASPTGMGGPDSSPSSAPAARAKSPESCLCACAPPCVPWDAHKKTLVALNSLENKQAALAMEKGLVESQVAKYKVEKKVLKQEVIRLRQAIQQGAAAAPAPAPAAAAANNA